MEMWTGATLNRKIINGEKIDTTIGLERERNDPPIVHTRGKFCDPN